MSADNITEILTTFKTLEVKEQSSLMKQLMTVFDKSVSACAGKKSKKAKDPDAPKREQSEATMAWITYVKAVQAETGLKYSEAMKEASTRREAGDPTAPAKSTKVTKPKKEKAGGAGSSDTDDDDSKSVASVKSTKSAKKAPKALDAPAKAPKAPDAPAKAPKAPDAPAKADKKPPKGKAAPPPPEEDEEEESLSPFKHKDKKTKKETSYYKSSRNELWLMNPDKTQGEWVGLYDPKKDTIDTSAPEPELE
jgi:hypothetical protein